MIAWLKNYVMSIISVCVVGLILECLLSKGNVKKYAMFCVSIILSVTLIQPLFNIKTELSIPEIQSQQVNIDYESAVRTTVQSIDGFENAVVSVMCQNNKISKVTIICLEDKLIDKALVLAKKEFIKKMINAIYGVEKENIYFSE